MSVYRTIESIGFALLAAIFSLAAATATEKETDQVELLTNTDFAPYIDASDDGGGLFTELVRAAYKSQNIDLKLRIVPWRRALQQVASERAIGTYSWGKGRLEQEGFLLSDPVFNMADVVVTRLPEFESPGELQAILEERSKPASMCLPLGWTLATVFRNLIEAGLLERIAPATINSCVEALFVGRVEIAVVPRFTAAAGLQTLVKDERPGPLSGDGLVMLQHVHVIRSTTHAVFANSPEGIKYRAALNRGLAAIAETGQYVEIVAKYLSRYADVDRAVVVSDLLRAGILSPCQAEGLLETDSVETDR